MSAFGSPDRFQELYGRRKIEPEPTGPDAAPFLTEKAQKIVESPFRALWRVAAEPAVSPETVRRFTEKVAPSTAEPSPVGGAASAGISLSSLFRSPQENLAAIAEGATRPRPLSESVRKVSEFQPSILDVASLGAGKLATIPIGLAVSKMAESSRAAKAARIAERLSESIEAAGRGALSETQALRTPGLERAAQVRSIPAMAKAPIKKFTQTGAEFRELLPGPPPIIEQTFQTPHEIIERPFHEPSQILEKLAKKPQPFKKMREFTPEVRVPSSSLESVFKPKSVVAKTIAKPKEFLDKARRAVIGNDVITEQIGRMDDFLREQASRSYKKETQQAYLRIANQMQRMARDTAKLSGEGIAEIRPALEVIANAPEKNRSQVARFIARYIQDPEFRDTASVLSPELEGVSEQVRGSIDRWRSRAVRVGIDSGFIKDYWPRYHPRLSEAIDLFVKGNTQEAFGIARKFWSESLDPVVREAIPDDFTLGQILDDEVKYSQRKEALKGFSGHLELSREHDIPGFLGDYRDSQFKPEDVVKVAEMYNAETASRTADAIHNGVNAERFNALVRQIPDQSHRVLIEHYAQRLRRSAGIDALEGRAASMAGTIRNLNILSSLGRAAVQNAFQTAITTLPRTAAAQGIIPATRDYLKTLHETLGPGREAAYAWAERIGAIQDDIIKEATALSEGRPLSSLASRFLDLTQFSATERWNNVASAVMGRNYGTSLADLFWRNPGDREAVAREIENILKSNPDMAMNFLQSAELGGARNVPQFILDEIGYQMAAQTQFRFGPTHLPLKWLTPEGKFFWQFKTYGYNYWKFLEDQIGRTAATGDFGPLISLGFSGIASGHLTRMARRALAFQRIAEGGPLDVEETPYEARTIKGATKALRGVTPAEWLGLDKPDGPGWEILNDFGTGVSLGLAGDLANEIARTGGAGMLEVLTPVTAEKAARGVSALVGKGGPGGIASYLLEEAVPSPGGIGRTLSQELRKGRVYQRPFMSPLIRGEKRFARTPIGAGALGKRVVKSLTPDLPSQEPATFGSPERMQQLYGGQ